MKAYRVLDGDNCGKASTIIEGIDRARLDGCKIINNSYTLDYEFHQGYQEAVQRCADEDILFVTGAGNIEDVDDPNLDEVGAFPATCPLPNVIVAAASDRQGRLWARSKWSSTQVDLAAPGELIYSTWSRNSPEGVEYRFLSGTSMSAAFVTGTPL